MKLWRDRHITFWLSSKMLWCGIYFIYYKKIGINILVVLSGCELTKKKNLISLPNNDSHTPTNLPTVA